MVVADFGVMHEETIRRTMDSTIIVGLVGAASTLVAALLGRSDLMDKFIRGSKFPRITGRWESTWTETENGPQKEIFTITRQKGPRIYGYITMESEPDKQWDLQGDFNGRFLRLFWHPSKEADDKLFLDYGCYFFELLGNGSFRGYAVGFDWGTDATEVYEHTLRRIK